MYCDSTSAKDRYSTLDQSFGMNEFNLVFLGLATCLMVYK